ncbi:MAG: hypothetical protein JWP35_1982 [Caulobacter sp.]|nr:hypothetical protein [Caulobacter sp.]
MPNPADTPSTTVDDLIAKDEILGVLHRYCHSCDRSDAQTLATCFHPDSITDHAGVTIKSLEWIPHALAWLADRVAVTHMIANPMIQVAGDRAISDCHFVAYNRSPKAGGDGWEETLVKGRYLDRFERRDGVWKIVHRTGIHDLERVNDAPANANDVAGEHRSGKAPNDPFYALLADFQAGR